MTQSILRFLLINMKKQENRHYILISIAIFILFLISNGRLEAEPLQDGFRYGTYGLVAGAIAGGASMAFSEDPGSHLTPVAKGASLGLYAGLLVAVYKNMKFNQKEPQFEVFPTGFRSNKNENIGFIFKMKY